MTEWAESLSTEEPSSICIKILHVMFLHCCCPIHKCVTVMSCFDTLIVAIFTYNYFMVLMDTINEPHWTTVLSFFFLLALLICQVVATVLVILAQKKYTARYCWPRLVLLTGLIICLTIAFIFIMFYFCGGASAMNDFFLGVFEFFSHQTLDSSQRTEIRNELQLYATGLFTLITILGIYSIMELLFTHKFYMSLKCFSALPQTEPPTFSLARHPAYNPDYVPPPAKIYSHTN